MIIVDKKILFIYKRKRLIVSTYICIYFNLKSGRSLLIVINNSSDIFNSEVAIYKMKFEKYGYMNMYITLNLHDWELQNGKSAFIALLSCYNIFYEN